MELYYPPQKRVKVFEKDFVARFRISLLAWLCCGFVGGFFLYVDESRLNHALLRLWFLPIYMLILIGMVGGAWLLGLIRLRYISVAEMNGRSYSIRKVLLAALFDFVVLFVLAAIYTNTGNVNTTEVSIGTYLADFVIAFGMYIVGGFTELWGYKHPETLRITSH